MKKIWIIIFLTTGFTKILSLPPDNKPIMIIDCGKKQGVFNDSCFKMVQFATNRLSESGVFSNVRSITNNSFLYRKSGQVFTMTLSENSNYKINALRTYFANEYKSEMSILCDKDFRYAAIYATSMPGGGESCATCTEINDTLTYSRIKSWFYSDNTFASIAAANLGVPFIRIQLNFKSFMPGLEPVRDIQSFYHLSALQNKLYTLGGVKTVYSAVNIFSFISSVLAGNLLQKTPEQKWLAVINTWELGGERRSSYIDFENNAMYLDIFTAGTPGGLSENIKKILTGYATDRISGWIIYDNSNNIIAKKDDAVKKEQTVTLDEQNTAGK